MVHRPRASITARSLWMAGVARVRALAFGFRRGALKMSAPENPGVGARSVLGQSDEAFLDGDDHGLGAGVRVELPQD